MKKSNMFSIASAFVLLVFLALGCNMSTANMSSLKTSSDKEGKSETAKFKDGDTLYARAQIANNMGKVKVKFSLVTDKGEIFKGSEFTVDIDGDGVAIYNMTLGDGVPASGNYKVNADMINDAGEKKDGKSASVTIE